MSEAVASNEAGGSVQDEQAVKFALAISILRSKLLHSQKPSDPDALRWKRKARERKQELLRLREEIDQAQDSSQCDLFPRNASCKCYFFDRLGKLSPSSVAEGSDRRFNDVLRRRFLRQVRFKERRRKLGSSVPRPILSDHGNGDEADQLRASVDFLVELCDTASLDEEANFTNWSHQAVDFILASLENLLSGQNDAEVVQGTICNLITRLVKKMLPPSPIQGNERDNSSMNKRFRVQHLVRKLGSEPFIGQRAMLSISQSIAVIGESLLFTDPFDVAFPGLNDCMFLMIQLAEFLISDYLSTWLKNGRFEETLFEEWVTSLLQAKKTLELLESRNGLYMMYMERVTGELSKQMVQVPSIQKINPEILDKLLC